MGPLVERQILEVEEELHQVKEDLDGEFVMQDNQFDSASSLAGNLRKHLKRYIREKSKKCNQCAYTSFYASHLRRHLITHIREKSNKCNQCDYTSFYASHLRRHLIIHSGEKLNKCNQCEYKCRQHCRLSTFTFLLIQHQKLRRGPCLEKYAG